jgi:predicted GNAT superfamily acetyltransferase
MMRHLDLDIRPLDRYEELQAAEELQADTWGHEDIVPATLQRATQKVGGVAAGAFDASGQLIGAIYGLTGPKTGRLVHWSHMLAIRKDWRDRGLGRVMKAYQRERMLELGVTEIYWTYDPLESRNAHFNLNRLGATIDSYVCDMYGVGTNNILHSVIGTDRFIAVWHLTAAPVEQILQGVKRTQPTGFVQAPIIQSFTSSEIGHDASIIRIEIPTNIQELKVKSPDDAYQWRQQTRTCFRHYISKGYAVSGFYRDSETSRCFYILNR